MIKSNYTFRLVKQIPTFSCGFSAIFDFFGNEEKKYNMDSTEKEADWNSVYSDWKAIGDDMKEAMEYYYG